MHTKDNDVRCFIATMEALALLLPIRSLLLVAEDQLSVVYVPVVFR